MKEYNCSSCGGEIVGEEGTNAICPLCQTEIYLEKETPPIIEAEKRQRTAALQDAPRLIQCPDCGKEVSARANVCPGCGGPLRSSYAPVVAVGRPKSRAIYITLAIFLGLLGIHNFYAGHRNVACIQLCLTLLLWWLVFPVILVFLWVLRDISEIKADGLGIPFATN